MARDCSLYHFPLKETGLEQAVHTKSPEHLVTLENEDTIEAYRPHFMSKRLRNLLEGPPIGQRWDNLNSYEDGNRMKLKYTKNIFTQ